MHDPRMLGRWQQGMTRAEREAARAALADWFAGHGHDEEQKMRSLSGAGCAIGTHVCDQEMPGGAGCPCRCHDARADRIAEYTAEVREAVANA